MRALTGSCALQTCEVLNLVVSFESSYQLSRLGIPDPDSAICRGAGQPCTAGRELYTDRAQIVTDEFMLQLVIGFVARCTFHAALYSKGCKTTPPNRCQQARVSERWPVSAVMPILPIAPCAALIASVQSRRCETVPQTDTPGDTRYDLVLRADVCRSQNASRGSQTAHNGLTYTLLEEPGNRAADAHAEVVLRKGVQEKRRRKKEKKKERPIVVTLDLP